MASVKVTGERQTAPESRRCPWCHAGDEVDGNWRVCERDNTPIHNSCLREFKVCPICHTTVEEKTVSPSVKVPSITNSRDMAPQDLYRLHGKIIDRIRHSYLLPGQHFTLMFAASLAGLISLWLMSFSVILGLLLLAVTAVLALKGPGFLARPRLSVFPLETMGRQDVQLAKAIVDGDMAILCKSQGFGQLTGKVKQIRQRRRRLGKSLEKARALFLERNTSIDEAQRIRGIGEGVVGMLRSAGIRTLNDLRSIHPKSAHGIGPQRAELVATWARDRRAAIQRLSVSGTFPESEQVDRQFASKLAKLDEEEERAKNNLIEMTATIESWSDEREEILRVLEQTQLGS